MSAALSSEGRGIGGVGSCETDNISALELQSNRRMLYFSDGVMEEPSSSDDELEADVPDKSYDVQIDERELPLGPRLRYKACKMGNNILAGIDYVGGGLASFLGITTSKYASELEYYKRAQEQDEAANDEDLDHWQVGAGRNNNSNNNNGNRNSNNEAIVLCEPARSCDGAGQGEGAALPPPSRQ